MENEDSDEVQFRQVNPQWMKKGVPTWQAFISMKNDNGKPSLSRSKSITAKDARDAFLGLELKSVGV